MTRKSPTPRSFPQIAASLGRHLRRNTFVYYLALLEGYALMVTAALMAANAFTALSLPGALIGLGPTGLAMAAGAAMALRANASPERIFRDADVAYDYHHLLPTAFGLWRERRGGQTEDRRPEQDSGPAHESGPTHESGPARDIREVVIRQGNAQAQYLRPETVYPLRLPRRIYLVPLGVLACVVILLAAQGLARPERPSPWAGYIQEFRNQSNRIARRSEALGDEEGARLAQQLEELSDTLESRPDEKEIERRLDELLPRLEEHMRNLGASDLIAGQRANRDRVEGAAEGSSSLRSRRVEEGEARGIDIGPTRPAQPGEGDGSSDRPTPLDGPNPEEREGKDEAEEGRVASPEGPEEGYDRDREGMEEVLQATRNNLRNLEDQLTEGETDGDGESEGEGENPRMAEQGPRGGPPPDGGSDRGTEDGSSAGTAGDEAGLGQAPDLADDPTSRLGDVIRRMTELPSSDEQTSFTELFSRETPGTPQSSLPERAVTPEFRRQVEAAVGRSTVPSEMQGYVRDYFLRIARSADAGTTPAVGEQETQQRGQE